MASLRDSLARRGGSGISRVDRAVARAATAGGFRLVKEHKHHFEAEGRSGTFRISKKALSKARLSQMQALCKGGTVKKMADGGYPSTDQAVPQGDYPAAPAAQQNLSVPGRIGNWALDTARDDAAGLAGQPGGVYGEAMNRVMAAGRGMLPGHNYADELENVKNAREQQYPGIYSVVPEVRHDAQSQALRDYTSGMAPGMVGPLGSGAIAEIVAHGSPTRWSPEPDAPLGQFHRQFFRSGEGSAYKGEGAYVAQQPLVSEAYLRGGKPLVEFEGVPDEQVPPVANDTLARLSRSFSKPGEGDVDSGALIRAAQYTMDRRIDDLGEEVKLYEQQRAAHPEPGSMYYDETDHARALAQLQNYQEARKFLTGLDPSKVKIGNSATLYKLDLPDELLPRVLDFDKPLSQQTPEVREALGRLDVPLQTVAGRTFASQEEAQQFAQSLGLPEAKAIQESEIAPDVRRISALIDRVPPGPSERRWTVHVPMGAALNRMSGLLQEREAGWALADEAARSFDPDKLASLNLTYAGDVPQAIRHLQDYALYDPSHAVQARAAILRLQSGDVAPLPEYMRALDADKKYTVLRNATGIEPSSSGEDLYHAIVRRFGAKGDRAAAEQASLALDKAGIPAHRFLDAGSRNFRPEDLVDEEPWSPKHAGHTPFIAYQPPDPNGFKKPIGSFGTREEALAAAEKGLTRNYVVYDPDKNLKTLSRHKSVQDWLKGIGFARGGAVGGGMQARPEVHFHLLGESPSHYHIGTRTGHALVISKAAISPTIHNQIRALPKMRGFADGGPVDPNSGTPVQTPPPSAPVPSASAQDPTPAAIAAQSADVYRTGAAAHAQQAQLASSPAAMAAAEQKARIMESQAAAYEAAGQHALAQATLAAAQQTRIAPVVGAQNSALKAQDWTQRAAQLEAAAQSSLQPPQGAKGGVSGFTVDSSGPAPLARPRLAKSGLSVAGEDLQTQQNLPRPAARPYFPPPTAAAPPMQPSHAPAQDNQPGATPTGAIVPANAPGPWAGGLNQPYGPAQGPTGAPPPPPSMPPPPPGVGGMGPPGMGPYDPVEDIARASEAGQTAIQAKGTAESQGYQRMAEIQEGATKALQARYDELNQQYQDNRGRGDALFQEWRQAVNAASNQKLDFNRFFANQSTGQKIMTQIGLALGALGSGFTQGVDAPLQMINSAIQRDIEQQKAQIGQKQWVAGQREGILNYFMKKTQDDQAASLLAISTLKEITAGQIQSASDRMLSGVAKPQADQLVAQMRMDADKGYLQARQLQLQNYSTELQYRMMQMILGQVGGGGGARAYKIIPSAGQPPMFTGDLNKFREDYNNRIVPLQNIPGMDPDAAIYARTEPGAKNLSESLDVFAKLGDEGNQLIRLAKEHPWGIHGKLGPLESKAAGDWEFYRSSMVTEINRLQQLNRLNPQEYKSFMDMVSSTAEMITPGGLEKLRQFQADLNAKRMRELIKEGVDPRSFPGGLQGNSPGRLPERAVQ